MASVAEKLLVLFILFKPLTPVESKFAFLCNCRRLARGLKYCQTSGQSPSCSFASVVFACSVVDGQVDGDRECCLNHGIMPWKRM